MLKLIVNFVSKSLHVGLLPSCGLVSLHTADLEAMSRPQLRVPPTSDRVLLNGRHAHFHTLNKSLSSSIWDGIVEWKRPKSTGKLLFTTTTKRGSSPPRVSVYSAVLAEAKPEQNEPGVPSNALLHTFTLAAQDRILMVAPVQPNPLQELEQPEPKPDTAKKPFKLLVIIVYVIVIDIFIAFSSSPWYFVFRYASRPMKTV